MFDVIVVGGGIVGTAVAYRCVQHGARTLLVDGTHRGRATDAGAGIVSPDTTLRDGGPNWLLAEAARAFYPALLDHLVADGAPPTAYSRCGEVVVASDETEAERLGALLDALGDPGRQGTPPSQEVLHEISPAEAQDRFPALGRVTRAFWSRDAARVDGRMLTRAMRTAGESRGLEIETGTVEQILVDCGRVRGVALGEIECAAINVVLAGGAWSAQLGSLLGVSLGVRPQRGQIAHLFLEAADTTDWPVVTSLGHHYIVSWSNGHVAVGATHEDEAGWDARVTAEGTRDILARAISIAPGLAQATVREVRVGLRPIAERGYPYIGSLPTVEGGYVATGHGAHGLAYGPWSGYAVADLALGVAGPDISAFGV